jgi:hypothetical protein
MGEIHREGMTALNSVLRGETTGRKKKSEGFTKEFFVGVVSLSNYAGLQCHLTTLKGGLFFLEDKQRQKLMPTGQ